MARPTKQGIDYFPIDTHFDDKTELYILEKESTGLSVLVVLWQLIYHNEGYYIDNKKDLHLLIKKRINVCINEINDCINVCLSRGIFCVKLHKKYKILTSKAIQKRYFDAAKRKKSVDFNINYIINGVNVSENAVNVLPQSPNVNVNVKEDVKEDVKERHCEFVYLTKPEHKKLIKKFGEQGTEDRIENLNEGIGSRGYKYNSHYHTILAWDRKNNDTKTAKEKKQDKELKEFEDVMFPGEGK